MRTREVVPTLLRSEMFLQIPVFENRFSDLLLFVEGSFESCSRLWPFGSSRLKKTSILLSAVFRSCWSSPGHACLLLACFEEYLSAFTGVDFFVACCSLLSPAACLSHSGACCDCIRSFGRMNSERSRQSEESAQLLSEEGGSFISGLAFCALASRSTMLSMLRVFFRLVSEFALKALLLLDCLISASSFESSRGGCAAKNNRCLAPAIMLAETIIEAWMSSSQVT